MVDADVITRDSTAAVIMVTAPVFRDRVEATVTTVVDATSNISEYPGKQDKNGAGIHGECHSVFLNIIDRIQ
ncbi:protein of unknown function [Pseudodesulfovibrio profundus]|uniref:Uncharacterized protein n=1 Tax=Pseudodesulfovibrio profundus TaxID=57320 RepID=A0A2C8FAV9_9BACT|nr:protein of unknown function [Pseudodesulfovibrio profundus]